MSVASPVAVGVAGVVVWLSVARVGCWRGRGPRVALSYKFKVPLG